jgi:hypothetical protein
VFDLEVAVRDVMRKQSVISLELVLDSASCSCINRFLCLCSYAWIDWNNDLEIRVFIISMGFYQMYL